MALTHGIGYSECKKVLDVGQSSCDGNADQYIYQGDNHLMRALGIFLFKHRNHSLIFSDEDKFIEEEYEHVEGQELLFEEYKREQKQ